MTRVLVVDDHPIVRQGCRRVLSDMGVADIDEAESVVAGYRAFLRRSSDCIITDLTFEGDDLAGLSLVQRIAAQKPEARIVVFSMHDDPAIVSRALKCGAHGYVLKDSPSGELTTALSRVLGGDVHLSHELAIRVATLRSKGEHLAIGELTEREQQILSLLGLGNSYDTIATKLGISYKTVANVTSMMRTKLKLTSLADLMRLALQNNRPGSL